jgi:hypothetical protein
MLDFFLYQQKLQQNDQYLSQISQVIYHLVPVDAQQMLIAVLEIYVHDMLLDNDIVMENMNILVLDLVKVVSFGIVVFMLRMRMIV